VIRRRTGVVKEEVEGEEGEFRESVKWDAPSRIIRQHYSEAKSKIYKPSSITITHARIRTIPEGQVRQSLCHERLGSSRLPTLVHKGQVALSHGFQKNCCANETPRREMQVLSTQSRSKFPSQPQKLGSPFSRSLAFSAIAMIAMQCAMGGELKDAHQITKFLIEKYPHREIYLSGFSLDGNLSLKMLGELGTEATAKG
jgi:hypothetical protein